MNSNYKAGIESKERDYKNKSQPESHQTRNIPLKPEPETITNKELYHKQKRIAARKR